MQYNLYLNSRFRNGIFICSLLLGCSIGLYALYSKEKNVSHNFVIDTVVQQQIDSLRCLPEKELSIKQFNPNFITDYKGYILGLSSEELDRLYTYRKQGNWINSISDFKKITGVSDTILIKIGPLFKFPGWVQRKRVQQQNFQNKVSVPLSFEAKKDLNRVTAKELEEIIGLPAFIARRIIKYRQRLDGFVDDIQLKDVYGLYDRQRQKINSLYIVKNPKIVKKVNVNTATIDELMQIPYFDFQTALRIVEVIEEKQGISEFKELIDIDGFSLEKIDRIALYLALK